METKKLLNNKEMATFCTQASILLRAGLLTTDAMQILKQDSHTESADNFYDQICKSIWDGSTFHKALEQTGIFPAYALSMVALGEETGQVDTVLKSLAEYYEREEDISNQIRSAISYPMVMIGMMFLVILVLITKVLPIFDQVFVQLGSEMAGFPTKLMHLGEIIRTYYIVFLLFFVLLLAFYFVSTKTKKGRLTAKKLFCHIPAVRRFFSDISAGRFAGGLAMAWTSGLDVYKSLELVADLMDTSEMKEKVLSCRKEMANGTAMQNAVADAGIFSTFYSRMVSVGERSGAMDEVLTKISKEYDKKSMQKLDALISVLEPTLVIILSLIVGMILLSVILPLMGIMSSIG